MQTYKVRYHDLYADKALYKTVRAASHHAARAAILDNAPAFRYVVRSVQPVNNQFAA